MVFNSITFVVFLAMVLVTYYRLGHKGQNWMLLLASYLFYGWWDYRFLGLLLFTTLFDYGCALWIDREENPGRRRLYLASSMVVNLGVLCLFKYFNFFAESLQQAMGVLGISLSFPMLHVVLPVGISFYTFLSMSYTIDVYRRELKATRDPIDFMLYVAFFPHLVAGPIVRASYLLPQCQRPRTIVPEEVANGIWLIAMGYVKKVVVADRLAQVVNWGFASGGPPFSDANSWLVIYAFAFQIYGDFSGYSDIARGVSKLMGFDLVVNFRAPYLVTNAASFWRHWHISLSAWLRDYLYIPLGGNRLGAIKTYRNLMLTMFLGGLWHGAGAAYVLWGVYHGALLAIQRGWQDLTGRGRADKTVAEPGTGQSRAEINAFRRASPGAEQAALYAASPSATSTIERVEEQTAVAGPERIWLPAVGWAKNAVLVLVFFHLTCIGWLFFRAGALPRGVGQLNCVLQYLHAMVMVPKSIDPIVQGIAFLGGISLLFQWKSEEMNRFSEWPVFWQTFGVVASVSAVASLGVFEGAQFIYFQF